MPIIDLNSTTGFDEDVEELEEPPTTRFNDPLLGAYPNMSGSSPTVVQN